MVPFDKKGKRKERCKADATAITVSDNSGCIPLGKPEKGIRADNIILDRKPGSLPNFGAETSCEYLVWMCTLGQWRVKLPVWNDFTCCDKCILR